MTNQKTFENKKFLTDVTIIHPPVKFIFFVFCGRQNCSRMEDYEKIIRKYLRQTATIHIYSFPYFILETFLALVILLLYVLLHLEVSKIYKKMLRLRPNSVYCETHSGSISKDSLCSVTTHYREVYTVSKHPSTTIAYKRIANNIRSTNSQLGWILPTHPIDESLASRPLSIEKKKYAEKIANLTPEQFVKIDKERKLREKELDSYMTSLSTLCKNVLNKKYSSQTLQKQVEMAKENLQCNKTSLEGKYLGFKTEAMTKSLFNMLEQMITNSSLQNPLPFKGDITTLALDVADLSTDNQYFTRDIAKWETNSSSCISETTNETESVDTFKEEQSEKDETLKVKWQQ
ncbi:hypothetical protein ILUMI_26397 [Ignelater luminosus]|uniref:Uncharacterized protein n=1 Tax=Ignelater luminosus TaxID=2038154 RepID=A0A8K0C6S3_IGNLU|nr:hypothetical protein ILUMI_26397 [Ignelater luminosus]